MKLKRKLLLSTTALVAVVAPIATVISCGAKNNINWEINKGKGGNGNTGGTGGTTTPTQPQKIVIKDFPQTTSTNAVITQNQNKLAINIDKCTSVEDIVFGVANSLKLLFKEKMDVLTPMGLYNEVNDFVSLQINQIDFTYKQTTSTIKFDAVVNSLPVKDHLEKDKNKTRNPHPKGDVITKMVTSKDGPTFAARYLPIISSKVQMLLELIGNLSDESMAGVPTVIMEYADIFMKMGGDFKDETKKPTAAIEAWEKDVLNTKEGAARVQVMDKYLVELLFNKK